MTESQIWDIIIVLSAIGTIISSVIVVSQRIAKHRRKLPKINIRLEFEGPIESPQGGDARLVKFNRIHLILSNASAYNAYNISFSTVLDKFVENDQFDRINKLSKILVEDKDLVFDFGLAGLISDNYRSKSLEEKFTLILKSRQLTCGFMLIYENDRSKKFATQYQWNDGNPKLKYLRL